MCETAQSSSNFEDPPAIYQETVNRMKFQYFRVKSKKARYDKSGNMIRPGSRGIKKGIMVAAPSPFSEDKIVVGYTLCNFKEGDEFNAEFWLPVALERAITWAEKEESIDPDFGVPKFDIYSTAVPESMKRDFAHFLFRMKKWFKGKDLPIWANLFMETQGIEEGLPKRLTVAQKTSEVH